MYDDVPPIVTQQVLPQQQTYTVNTVNRRTQVNRAPVPSVDLSSDDIISYRPEPQRVQHRRDDNSMLTTVT